MERLSRVIGIFCLLVFLPSRTILAEDIDSDTRRYATDLEKIVVTASKIEQRYKTSTQNISIITKEDIEASGITQVTEILDLLPCVNILEYGSIGSTRSVHVRGTSSSQVLTLVDGRPINTSRDGVTDFNQIPLSIIERIEILRGPASSIYGASAIGGVINIITKSGREETKTEMLTKFGSFSTKLSSLTHGNKVDNLDYFISHEYLASHGHRDNSDYLSNNINTKFGYQLDVDNHIGISSGCSEAELGIPGSLSSIDLDDRQETYKKYIDMTYNGRMTEGQNIIFKLFHNFDRLESLEAFEPLDKDTHQTKVYGMDTQLSQTYFDIFRSAIGFSYQEHRFNSSNSEKHTYNFKGINFETETDLFEDGALKFGARWDDYSNFGDKLSPSASFNFWLFDRIKLHALTAKSFRAPTFNDLYSPQKDYGFYGGRGNPNLGPEKATSYEAGFSTYFFNKLKTDLTFFKTDFKGLLEWTTADNYWWYPGNVSSAVIKGAELETEFVLKEHLKANLNDPYLESKNKDTQKWMTDRPRHRYKVRLVYSPVPKYELGVNAIYKTKRFTNTGNTTFLERHFVMDSNFTYKINDSAQVLIEAKNILNEDYEEERGYSMPGRAFYVGLKLTF